MGANNPCGGGVGGFVMGSTALVLVLYILLVIILKGFWI
jgi:hypothetical protein